MPEKVAAPFGIADGVGYKWDVSVLDKYVEAVVGSKTFEGISTDIAVDTGGIVKVAELLFSVDSVIIEGGIPEDRVTDDSSLVLNGGVVKNELVRKDKRCPNNEVSPPSVTKKNVVK